LAREAGNQKLALLFLVLIAAGALAWMYWPKPRQGATADELAEQALSGENGTAQVRATVQLGSQRFAPQLREVMTQTRDPEVRATAAQALGNIQDFASVPELLRLCDDPSPLVRGRAGAAVCSILGADFPFHAEMSASERSKVIEAMRKMYEQMRRHPPDQYRSKKS
jgi:HEAT repeat protein